MMRLITATALVLLIAAPAGAKIATHRHPDAASVRGLYMQAGPMASRYDVVGADNRVRRDPDSNIRVQLHREYLEGE